MDNKRVYVYLTDDDREDIVRLRKEGQSLKEIADYIGCSISSVQLILKDTDNLTNHKWTTEEEELLVQKANELCDQRGRNRKLAEMFGVTKTSIDIRISILRKRGYKIKKRGVFQARKA